MTKSNNEINNTVSQKINEKLFAYAKEIAFIPNTILVFNIEKPFKSQLQTLFPQAEITVINMADLKESHFTFSDASVDLLLANITIILDLDLNRLFLDVKRILTKNGLFVFSTYDSSSKLTLEKYITKNAQQLILDERIVKRDLDKLYSLSYLAHEEQIKMSDIQSQAINIDIFTVTHMDVPEEADLLKRVNIESVENEMVESKIDKEKQESDKKEKLKIEADAEQELEEIKESPENEKIDEKEAVQERQELKEKEQGEEQEKLENKEKAEEREKPENEPEAQEEKEKTEKSEVNEEKPEFEAKETQSEKQEPAEKERVNEQEEDVKEVKESKEREEGPEESESEEQEEVENQESEEQQEREKLEEKETDLNAREKPEEKETDVNEREKSEEGEEPEVEGKEKYKEKFSQLENEMHQSKEQLTDYAEKLTQHLNDSADIISALSKPNLSLEEKKNKLAELQARNLEHKKMLTAYQNLHSQHRVLLNSLILSQEKVLEQYPYLNDQYHQLVEAHRKLLNKHDENIKEHQLFLKLT